MKNFKVSNSLILEEEVDLVVLPIYMTPNIKDNPIIKVLIDFYFPEKKKEILNINRTPGEILELYALDFKRTFWLFYFPSNMNAAILSLINQIQSKLLKSKFRSIDVSQIGIIEYGFNESEYLSKEKNKWEQFALNHHEMNILYSLVDDNHRPSVGRHLFDSYELKDGKPEFGLSLELNRKPVIIDENKVENYMDYFNQYIKLRELNKNHISCSLCSRIDSMKIFKQVIREDFYAMTNKRLNYSKWSHTYKNKSNKYYCQAPCKQTLKYLVLVLDMSESEVKQCFNFFGYGLALFNREDVLFIKMLRKNRPLDLNEIEAILKHNFGKTASLYYTGKK